MDAYQPLVLILGGTPMTLLPVLNQFEHVLTGQEGFAAFWDAGMHQIHGRIHGFAVLKLIPFLPMFSGEIYFKFGLMRI